jgi:two-component system, NtrC family, response regulator GlrR
VADPSRIETIPESRQDGVFSGFDLVTALRIRKAEVEHVMLAGQSKFTFGTAPGCDICVERRHVSFSHALLERRADRIRVTDLDSKNGIAFQGSKRKQFEIGPGDWFSIDESVFYALNDEMRLSRPVVSEILGFQRMDAIDDLLMGAVHGPHVFLRAEPGCDQERLGRAIHRMSLRRRHRFVIAQPGANDSAPVPQLVTHAHNGTLLLRLDATGARLDPVFVEALLSPEANVRVILCARSLKEAIDSVTESLASSAYRVEIPPVRERPGAIAPVLERWFIDRQSRLRFSDFTDDNQAALRAYRWPENLEELRKAADLLIQLAPYRSERTAAQEVNIPRSNVKRWLDALNLTLPLLRELADEPIK